MKLQSLYHTLYHTIILFMSGIWIFGQLCFSFLCVCACVFVSWCVPGHGYALLSVADC